MTVTVALLRVAFESFQVERIHLMSRSVLLVALAHHESSDVLQEDQRDAPLTAEFDKVSCLQRRLGEKDAIVRYDAHALPVQLPEPRHHRGPVSLLELLEAAAIDQPCDHLTISIGTG